MNEPSPCFGERTRSPFLVALYVAALVGCAESEERDAGPDAAATDASQDASSDAGPAVLMACPSAFAPVGCRSTPSEAPTLPTRRAWRNLHGDVTGSDEVSIAVGPRFREGWSAETDTFNVTGPVFDSDGNLYFAPLSPAEDVVLISLSPAGTRRFAIGGAGTGAPAGGGTPMIVVDPATGEEQVFLGLYDRAIALTTDGTVLWDVPTGLNVAAGTTGPPVFGLAHHPGSDALIGVASDGLAYVLDRATGERRSAAPFEFPGEPAPAAGRGRFPQGVADRVRDELSPLLDVPGDLDGADLTGVLLGGAVEVANFYSVDPHDGTLWVAATAPDAEDGTVDGESARGALYALELVEADAGLRLQERCHASFVGGSASTPALRSGGGRVYVGDSEGALIAIDPDCSEAWRVSVGMQIIGSIAAASDNGMLYAATTTHIVAIADEGERGVERWSTQPELDFGRAGEATFNLNIITVAENGLAFQAGAGRVLMGFGLPRTTGVGLLDRETGEVRSFTEGLDETVAVMSVGPDGALYIGNSPLRRAFHRVLFGTAGSEPLRGGITQFLPDRWADQARDAMCGARARARNAAAMEASCPRSAGADRIAIDELLAQTRAALARSTSSSELDPGHVAHIEAALDDAEAASDLNGVVSALSQILE